MTDLQWTRHVFASSINSMIFRVPLINPCMCLNHFVFSR